MEIDDPVTSPLTMCSSTTAPSTPATQNASAQSTIATTTTTTTTSSSSLSLAAMNPASSSFNLLRKLVPLSGEIITGYLRKVVDETRYQPDSTSALDLTKEFRAKDYPLIHLLLQNPLSELISMAAPRPTQEGNPRPNEGDCVPGYLYLFDNSVPMDARRLDSVQWCDTKKMNVKLIIYNEATSMYKLKNNKSDEGVVVMRRQTWRADGEDRGWRRNEYKPFAKETYFKQSNDGRLTVSEHQTLQEFPVLVHYFWKRETQAVQEAKKRKRSASQGRRSPPSSVKKEIRSNDASPAQLPSHQTTTNGDTHGPLLAKRARMNGPVPPSIPTFDPAEGIPQGSPVGASTYSTSITPHHATNGFANTITGPFHPKPTVYTQPILGQPQQPHTQHSQHPQHSPHLHSQIPHQPQLQHHHTQQTQQQHQQHQQQQSQQQQQQLQHQMPQMQPKYTDLTFTPPSSPSYSSNHGLSNGLGSLGFMTTVKEEPDLFHTGHDADGPYYTGYTTHEDPLMVGSSVLGAAIGPMAAIASSVDNAYKTDVRNYAPECGPAGDYTKLLVCIPGFNIEPHKAYRYSLVFEEIVVPSNPFRCTVPEELVVPAQLVSPGVLEAQAPPHKPGIVYFWVACTEDTPPIDLDKREDKKDHINVSAMIFGSSDNDKIDPGRTQVSKPTPFLYIPTDGIGKLTLGWELVGHHDLLSRLHHFKYACKELDLSNNNLVSVDFLEAFHNLDTLILDNNHITQTARFPVLPKLHTLCINHNWLLEIDKFMDNIVDCVPSLKYLSTLHNPACPFFSTAKHHYYNYRIYILSRLRNLTHLDSSPVTMEEWRHAACIMSDVTKAEDEEDEEEEGLSGPVLSFQFTALPE